VAHDFNNILSAIIGYGHLALTKLGKDEPLRQTIEQMLKASERAATLTQTLLSFSRKQTVNPTLLDLNELVRRFEHFLLRLIREDITLIVRSADEALSVMADSSQIEQVIMNLVTNARDAMPDGGRLTIEAQRVELDEGFVSAHGPAMAGKYALLSVSDNGIGMDARTQEKIFEPFFTTKEQGKGTGLGLSMVYGIVKRHNGIIHVYSGPGKGATVNIYLPLVTSAVENREEQEPDSVRGGTETILIAEDDDTLRMLAREILEGSGYTVIDAVNGEDAVRKFLADKDVIQLVILDGIMPKKNGKEAFEEMRASRPDIKALFTSGYAEDIFTKNGIPTAGSDFIQKPMTPTDLLRKVREALDKME
jgi:two-component system cell cycle sensor histidine kinase/response regulator CckA